MIDGEKVGLGLVTCRRPTLAYEAYRSVNMHLLEKVDHVWLFCDGPPFYDWRPEGDWAYVPSATNKGVAWAKAFLTDWMLRYRCEHIFLMEDDTLVTDEQAVTGYVAAAKASGQHYLSAHPWGEATTTCVQVDGPVTYWSHVGAMFTYMSRHGLETGGTYDPRFGNHHGDIELPQRWSRLGLCSGWGRLPDATGSEAWVQPRCLTPDKSLIGNTPGWAEENRAMLDWWAETMPDTIPTELRPARSGNRRRALPNHNSSPTSAAAR